MDWYEKSQLVGRFRRLTDAAKQRCWEFRDNPTKAEAAMWEIVRDKRLAGFKFRRQHKLGPFIADFYCHAACLVIEVDGPIHNRRRNEDAKRSEWLNSIGLKVIRFKNEEVLHNPELVRQKILLELTASHIKVKQSPGE